MAIRMLNAAAAASLLFAASASAATTPTVVKTWFDGPMPVNQFALPDGSQKCHFGQVLPTGDEFSISQFSNGQIAIFLARKGDWSKGGKISFTVDGGVPFVVAANLANNGLLAIGVPNEGAGRDFLHDLWNGQTLYVAAGPMQAAFSLAGSATAIAVLHQCAEAIGAPLPPPLPAGTPVVPPPPLTVATAPNPTPAVIPPPPSGIHEASLINDGTGLFVDAMVNGQSMRFVLDSGASAVRLPTVVADRLVAAGALTLGDFQGQSTATVADGRSVAEQVYTIRSLTVGDITVHNVRATVSAGGEPLLGLTFLSRLSSWSIDNQRGVLVMGRPT